MSVVESLMQTAFDDTELLKKNDALGDDFAKPRTLAQLYGLEYDGWGCPLQTE
jgi:hypothetical protein